MDPQILFCSINIQVKKSIEEAQLYMLSTEIKGGNAQIILKLLFLQDQNFFENTQSLETSQSYLIAINQTFPEA